MDTKHSAPFSLAASEATRNHLVHFSSARKYVYVEVPKAGCTTVKRVLQLAELDGDRDRLPKQTHDRDASPLLSPGHFPQEFEETWHDPEAFRFTFVRNPFTRILSAYLDKIVTNEWERRLRLPKLGLELDAEVELIEFLDIISGHSLDDLDMHWAPQAVLTGVPHNVYDRVYPFESFLASVADALTRLGLPQYIEESKVRPAHATNAHEKLAQYYGPDEIDAVVRMFRDDFSLFGYSTDLEAALDEPAGLVASVDDAAEPRTLARPVTGSNIHVAHETADQIRSTTIVYGAVQRAMRNGPMRRNILATSEYREALAAEIAEEMDRAPVELLTVDVFDTVLIRHPTSELRRFYEMAVISAQHESRLLDTPVTGVDLLLARLHATHGSYRLSEPVLGCREGTIDQIARIVARSLQLSEGAAERLIQRELTYEQQHLTPNLGLVRLLDEVQAQGIPVVLLSDMYLRRVDIRQLLDHAGVLSDAELYSSADIRVSKRSGRAFTMMADRAGVAPPAILHLGDSLLPDFQAARRAGVRAIHLPIPEVERSAIRADHADVAGRLRHQGIDVTRWISGG